jgi:hypothetical protein
VSWGNWRLRRRTYWDRVEIWNLRVGLVGDSDWRLGAFEVDFSDFSDI